MGVPKEWHSDGNVIVPDKVQHQHKSHELLKESQIVGQLGLGPRTVGELVVAVNPEEKLHDASGAERRDEVRATRQHRRISFGT